MKKKVRRLSALLLACVMIFAMQSTAFASAAGDDEGVMPLDGTKAYEIYLTAQTANMQTFGERTATSADHIFNVTFTKTEGPTAVRVYLFDKTTSTKLDEKTLHLQESLATSIPVGDVFFGSVMWVEGSSGNVTLQLTWS